VTHLTGMTSLNLGSNELSADDCARVCGAAAAAGMTRLVSLELGGNGFHPIYVVRCEGWKEVGLSCPSDNIFFPSSFSSVLQYALSSDRAGVAESDIALSVIFIKGATGIFDFAINGPYVCTSKNRLYTKLGDSSMCIERIRSIEGEFWQIKDVSRIGYNKSLAKIGVKYNFIVLEDCLHSWSVKTLDRTNHTNHEVQPDVKMLTGAIARQEVSRFRPLFYIIRNVYFYSLAGCYV
jgi:hypothetical protein